MTTFETLILLTVIAIEIIFVIHSYCVIKELKEIRYRQSGLNSKLQSILDTCIEQQNARFDLLVKTIVADLSRTRKAAVVCEDKITELLAFETRTQKRNDEMFARCEEINKLQLADLKARVHTYETEPFLPKDVVGVTSTGICQECNSKSECEHYDINRNRCFVTDSKED